MGLVALFTLGIFNSVVVKEGTNCILTRFGKYRTTLEPGLHFYLWCWGILGSIHSFSWMDPVSGKVIRLHEVDVREIVYDYPKEKVISKDNVQYSVDAVIYFRIVDPYRAVFKINDCLGSIRKLVQSILRAELGNHQLEEAYTNRSSVSEALTLEADKATDDWGIKVIRLEIKEFDLGAFAQQLLNQKQQEIEKRKAILEAEGEKEAMILSAEAEKESAVRRAEGLKIAAESEAKAVTIKAEAEAKATKMTFSARQEVYEGLSALMKKNDDLLRYLELEKAVEAAQKMADSKNAKLYLPNEVSGLMANFSLFSEAMKTSQAAQ